MKIMLVLIYLTSSGFEERARWEVADLGNGYTTRAYEYAMRECERMGTQLFITVPPVPEPYLGVATYCEAVRSDDQ